MRYVCFSDASGSHRPGVLEAGSVRPLEGVESIDAYVALSPVARAQARDKLSAALPLANVRLHAPLRPKKNVFCVGRNYLAHAEEGARALGEALDLPKLPCYFTKAPTAI